MSDDPLDETRSATRGSAPPSAARTWGELDLLEEIGAGGFGRVYRARDPTLAREVALKVIAVRTPEQASAVLREGRLLARVRHRNVVTVHAARLLGDQVGLTMELVRGENLSDLVRRSGPMGAEEATVIGLSVCQALAAVHGAGLVHRDVKTRNVMRESGGRIVLMDFGAGRELEDLRTDRRLDLSGTPLYLAPELFAGETASAASDLYSVGVLLFFLVTARYPTEGRTFSELALAHSLRRRRLLADVRPDLPPPFAAVVERALARDPAQRFETAGAMLRALGDATPAAAEGSRADVNRAGARGRTVDSRAGRSVATGLAGVGAAALAVGALGLVTSSGFNLTLGRTGGFSDDTVMDWWVFGLRSLVTPVVYAALTLTALLAVRAAWLITRRTARGLADRIASLVARARVRLGLADPASLAQWLLVLQVLVLVAIVWRFGEVLAAVTVRVQVADPATLAVLSETSDAPVAYRRALSIALVATGLGWLALVRTGGRIDRATKAGGVVIVGIMLLMLELPYRLMFHNRSPVIVYEELRCFDLGRRSTGAAEDVLVYCPDWSPPRIRVLDAGDATIRGTGERADLFGRPGPPALEQLADRRGSGVLARLSARGPSAAVSSSGR